MKRIISSLKVKLLVVMVLAGLTFHMVYNSNSTSACIECVTLTGALCVGCDASAASGHEFCAPIQSSCSCNVQGTCSESGPVGESGGSS